MGTPEVVKPHSIWVLEHRLCPEMSRCFTRVATRVATFGYVEKRQPVSGEPLPKGHGVSSENVSYLV